MAEENVKDLVLMDKIVSLCKRRGFVFPSSEIYGGINGFWDYGPYGARMKRAVENLWWHEMVETRDNVEGLDSTIICHPRVWKASGHLDQFSDLMNRMFALASLLTCSFAFHLHAVEIGAPVPGSPGIVYATQDGSRIRPAPGYTCTLRKSPNRCRRPKPRATRCARLP